VIQYVCIQDGAADKTRLPRRSIFIKRKKLRDSRRPRPIKTARSSVFGSGYFSNVDEPAALPPLI
jgi:hypothetical protein